jgi:hypothetical protein
VVSGHVGRGVYFVQEPARRSFNRSYGVTSRNPLGGTWTVMTEPCGALPRKSPLGTLSAIHISGQTLLLLGYTNRFYELMSRLQVEMRKSSRDSLPTLHGVKELPVGMSLRNGVNRANSAATGGFQFAFESPVAVGRQKWARAGGRQFHVRTNDVLQRSRAEIGSKGALSIPPPNVRTTILSGPASTRKHGLRCSQPRLETLTK